MENQITRDNLMVLEIRELLEKARKTVAQQVNAQLLTTYWNIGRIIVEYEKCQIPSGKLSWSHYCELLSFSDTNKRNFYEQESINSGWSVRELKRQIDSSLYERLLLSNGDANKEKAFARLDLLQKVVDFKIKFYPRVWAHYPEAVPASLKLLSKSADPSARKNMLLPFAKTSIDEA